MSTDVYAGQLCATHVNEWITHPELPTDTRWVCREIRHSHRYSTVMILAQSIHPSNGRENSTVRTLRLAPDEIVTFSVR